MLRRARRPVLPVLIESDWNLKVVVMQIMDDAWVVLIESDWNLKSS